MKLRGFSFRRLRVIENKKICQLFSHLIDYSIETYWKTCHCFFFFVAWTIWKMRCTAIFCLPTYWLIDCYCICFFNSVNNNWGYLTDDSVTVHVCERQERDGLWTIYGRHFNCCLHRFTYTASPCEDTHTHTFRDTPVRTIYIYTLSSKTAQVLSVMVKNKTKKLREPAARQSLIFSPDEPRADPDKAGSHI